MIVYFKATLFDKRVSEAKCPVIECPCILVGFLLGYYQVFEPRRTARQTIVDRYIDR